MGTTLADLEQAGLVQRRPHPTDGRQVLFELTAEGVEARRQRNIAKREWLLAAMARLDPAEQQTLIAAAALMPRAAIDIARPRNMHHHATVQFCESEHRDRHHP
jgi:DNA-binding MarR family transcriptional regulator